MNLGYTTPKRAMYNRLVAIAMGKEGGPIGTSYTPEKRRLCLASDGQFWGFAQSYRGICLQQLL